MKLQNGEFEVTIACEGATCTMRELNELCGEENTDNESERLANAIANAFNGVDFHVIPCRTELVAHLGLRMSDRCSPSPYREESAEDEPLLKALYIAETKLFEQCQAVIDALETWRKHAQSKYPEAQYKEDVTQ